MSKKGIRYVTTIVAGVMIYFGFRFVTQAGQGLGVVQNDGYGGSGGVLILIGGLIIGYLCNKREK
jgi:hypothetical protein